MPPQSRLDMLYCDSNLELQETRLGRVYNIFHSNVTPRQTMSFIVDFLDLCETLIDGDGFVIVACTGMFPGMSFRVYLV